MKQRITSGQLNKLTEEQKKQLQEWWMPSEGDQVLCGKYGIVTIHINGDNDEGQAVWINCGYNLIPENPIPLLSIGQMIEFIQEKRPQFKNMAKDRFGKWFVTIDTVAHGHKDEICDSLWETVTRVLKTESQ